MKALKIVFTGLMIIISCSLMAQPHVPDDHGSATDETPGGGGAPVGSGLLILLSMGGAYAWKKWSSDKKE